VTEIWTVPGFTQVRELGEGDTGRVVQAVDDLTRTPVAIKYLDDRLRRDERFQSRFRAAARQLGRLEDPNLVQFYDYVESPQASAIIMELVEGTSLARLLNGGRQTGPLAALAVFSGSLMGLAALHDAGIAHGRYKPASVLVDGAGIGKLTDAAFSVDGAGGGSGGSGTQRARGTGDPGNPDYLSPERWDGGAPSVADDLYAATAVFFECLTGRPPFRARNLSGLAKAHRTEPIPLEAVPKPLRALISAGLAKTPGARPASAADFLAALDDTAVSAYGSAWEAQGRGRLTELARETAAAWSAQAAAPGSAPPPGPARPTASPRRRRLIAGVAVAAVLLVAIGYGVSRGIGSGGASPAQSASPLTTPTQPPMSAAAPKATPQPRTPAELADVITKAAAAQRSATFVHRRDACCGAATAARGVFSFTPSAPTAYDMTVWSAARRDPYAKRTRTVLVGDIAYVAAGSWHPTRAAAVPTAARADATRGYASIAAQTRWGTSVQDIQALLRSTRTLNRAGLTYSGSASLSTLARDGSVGPLYAPFAASPGGAQVAFRVRVDRDFLPRSLQVTVTPRAGGRARSQVFRTTYSGWGRKVSIRAPR
jgi:hypothetical protein